MLPVAVLENDSLKLIPLQTGEWIKVKHLATDPQLWSFFPHDLSSEKNFERWMESRIAFRQDGKWYPYLIFDKLSSQYAGLSCYLNVDEKNKTLEIGGTWYGSTFQGTHINPNAKWLLMTNAFETLHFERVEFKTDALNKRSRAAIEKLGAKYEGSLRSNRIVQNERRRDTVYYSVLKMEWPAVKAQLEKRMNS